MAGLPSIKVRWRSQVHAYEVDYRWHGKRYRIYKYEGYKFHLEGQAREIAAQIRGEIRQHLKGNGFFDPGKYYLEPKSAYNVRRYIKTWLREKEKARKSRSPDYLRKLSGYANKYFYPCLGKYNIQDLSAPVISKFYFDDLEGKSQHYAKNIMQVLKQILDHAVDAGIIPKRPKFPEGWSEVTYHNPNWLTEEEQDRILGEVPKQHLPIMRFIYHTGCRRGEARGLQWDCIKDGYAIIRRQIQGTSHEAVDKTKGKRDRIVPLTREVLEDLEALPRAISNNYVYLHNGHPYRDTTLWKIGRAACDAAGFPRIKPFHEAGRHSVASQALMRSGDLRKVQDLMGHASTRTTEIYTHVLPEGLRDLVRGTKVEQRKREAENKE